MSDKKLKITISPLGKPTIEAVGFEGVGCAEATANVEKALSGAGVSVDRVMKPEWHMIESETETEGVKMTW